MLLGLLDGDLILANAIMNGHCEIGNGSEGGDEGSQDVEQAFLLENGQRRFILRRIGRSNGSLTTGTRKAIT